MGKVRFQFPRHERVVCIYCDHMHLPFLAFKTDQTLNSNGMSVTFNTIGYLESLYLNDNRSEWEIRYPLIFQAWWCRRRENAISNIFISQVIYSIWWLSLKGSNSLSRAHLSSPILIIYTSEGLQHTTFSTHNSHPINTFYRYDDIITRASC